MVGLPCINTLESLLRAGCIEIGSTLLLSSNRYGQRSGPRQRAQPRIEDLTQHVAGLGIRKRGPALQPLSLNVPPHALLEHAYTDMRGPLPPLRLRC